ncbi:hypothetical protein Tco_0836365 [Tanacetum coccineum]
MWNNVANIPSLVPKAASVPAGIGKDHTSVLLYRNRPPSVFLLEDWNMLLRPTAGCSGEFKAKYAMGIQEQWSTVTFGGGRKAKITEKRVTISDPLGKFEGKIDEGFIVGYAAHSKAYRVYNLSNKKIEETLNLRYLEDKPNVQGLGHEWYFDLDYLTDSLGLLVYKTNQPAGPNHRKKGFLHGKIDSATGVSYGPTETSTPVFTPVHTAATSLPPGHSSGSSKHSTRYPSPSDLANSIDFGGTVTNLAPSIVVDSVLTKRVNTIHPQSQILGDLTSPVQTRGTLKKSKFGASAFVSYVHDQQRNNYTDYLHCLFCLFYTHITTEPAVMAQGSY